MWIFSKLRKRIFQFGKLPEVGTLKSYWPKGEHWPLSHTEVSTGNFPVYRTSAVVGIDSLIIVLQQERMQKSKKTRRNGQIEPLQLGVPIDCMQHV